MAQTQRFGRGLAPILVAIAAILPIVSNGPSLCRLHHAAFDAKVLGITPDLHVEVRTDVLEEEDGPMLKHGLRDFHGSRLANVPRAENLRPRREFLEERYEAFRKAS